MLGDKIIGSPITKLNKLYTNINLFVSKHPLIFSFLYSSLFLVFFVFSFGLHYETNDDAYISEFVCNYSEYHFRFVNYFLCFIIGTIYKIIPVVNIWSLFLLGIDWICCIGLIYIFIKRKNGLLRWFFIVLFSIILTVDLFSYIQFTKVSSFAVLTGLIFLLDYLIYGKTLNLFIGFAFFTIGSLIRFDNYKLGLAFLVATVIALLTEKFYFEKRKLKIDLSLFKNKKKIVCFIISLLFIIVIPYTLKTLSDNVNVSTNELKENNEYMISNSSLIDYGKFPDYESNKEKYEEIGFSENDLNLIKNWMVDLDGYITTEDIKNILEFSPDVSIMDKISSDNYSLQGKIKLVISGFSNSFNRFTKFIFQNNMSINKIVFSIAVITVLYVLFDKKKILSFAIIYGMGYVLFTYLFFNGRYNNRSLFGIFVGILLLSCYFFDDINIRKTLLKLSYGKEIIKTNKKLIICIYLTVLCSISCYSFQWFDYIKEYYYTMNVNTELENYLDENSDNVYVSGNYSVIDYGTTLACHPLSGELGHNNLIGLGGWGINLPEKKENLKNLGIENIYKDMIDNKKIHILMSSDDSEFKILTDYLDEHYVEEGKKTKLVCTDKVGDAYICSVVSYIPE